MLRGNHETSEVNSLYGFKDDCLEQYDLSVWEAFSDCFNCLPLVCLVGNKILCMHGGLSPNFSSLDQIRDIPRPLDIPQSGLICDLLWSDPTPEDVHNKNCGYCFNSSRNTSVWFCNHAIKDFMQKHAIARIVRGHEMPEEGFAFSCDKRLVTLFTAPRYCGGSNDSAIMHIDKDLHFSIECIVRVTKPEEALKLESAKQTDELTRRESKKTGG
uniref:Serine/threonine-protein phosphatase n=1 Tax=Romanomermis culicivorax TaxID=13658 RepID=A0A915L5M8_ROMCU